MATHSVIQGGHAPTVSIGFDRFAGACAVLAGLVSVGYAVAFLVLSDPLLSGLGLLLNGIFASAALAGLFEHLRATDAAWARWGVALAGLGALGSAIHGGYDLANALHPPAEISSNAANLPNAVDPRGLLTFGLAGIGILTLSQLMRRSDYFPAGLAVTGTVLALLLVALYLGRLIVLDASYLAIVVPTIAAGFVVSPLWYIWLGLRLWRGAGA